MSSPAYISCFMEWTLDGKPYFKIRNEDNFEVFHLFIILLVNGQYML